MIELLLKASNTRLRIIMLFLARDKKMYTVRKVETFVGIRNAKNHLEELAEIHFLNVIPIASKQNTYIKFCLNHNFPALQQVRELIYFHWISKLRVDGYFPSAEFVALTGEFIGRNSQYNMLIVTDDKKKAYTSINRMKPLVHFDVRPLILPIHEFYLQYGIFTTRIHEMLTEAFIAVNRLDIDLKVTVKRTVNGREYDLSDDNSYKKWLANRFVAKIFANIDVSRE